MLAAFSRATRREFTGLSLLGGIDDAALEEVLVLLSAGVVVVVALAVLDLVDDDAAFKAGVLDDHAQGLLDGATDDLDAELLVLVLGPPGLLGSTLVAELDTFELLGGADEGGAATGEEEVPVALR